MKEPGVNEKVFLRTGRAFIAFWGLHCDTDIRNMGCLGLGFSSTTSWLLVSSLTSLCLRFLICLVGVMREAACCGVAL